MLTSPFVSPYAVYGQKVAISTDLLKTALLTPNIGVEVVLANRSSLVLNASYNSWGELIPNLSLDHVSITPGYRFWFKRALYSHFIGVNTNFTAFDMKYQNTRYKGYAAALGIEYGYSIMLSKRWNLTPSIGVCYGFCRKYENPELGEMSAMKNMFTPMITNIGFNLQYIIR